MERNRTILFSEKQKISQSHSSGKYDSRIGRSEDKISDYDSILFSIFYHDIIYKATSKDNEEKSAEKAKIRLEKLNISNEKITQIYNQILATKSHKRSKNSDTNFLLDADLAILGQDWEIYKNYIQQIRKEYSIYPDFLYNPGRKKVLSHFLEFEEIFKTDYFKAKYEEKARENITRELKII